MNTPPEHGAKAQTLTEFRAWMLSLSDEDLAAMGVKSSVEEPLRLLRRFAAESGATLT